MTNSMGCSALEWDTRVELAALYHLAAHYGWSDLTSTHISARIPGDDDHYLLNCHDMMFQEITASNLKKMTYDDGRIVDDQSGLGSVVNLAGHIIHSGVLRGRPDVNFVVHSHTRAGTAVSAMPGGLRPLSQHAGFVIGTLSTHPYQDSTAVLDEGVILCADLKQNFAMLLQNHGLLVVGRTAAEAFIYHYYLEMACKIQVDILAGTDNPIEITKDAMTALHDWGSPANGPHGGMQWPSLIRMLDQTAPPYRT